MIVHEAPDVLRDFATDAARTFLKELLPQALRQLREAWPLKRRRLLRELPAKLRDCVTDLRACFAPRGPASFIHVVSNLGLEQTDQWRYVNDRLSMARSWFQAWDEMQRAVGEQMNPEFFVRSLEGLNDLLFWTSHSGEHLSGLVDQTPKKGLIRKPMHALVDKYNAFLTNYEAYLRRLPEELGVGGMSPAPGMEKFFLRLRYPERE